MMSTSLTIPMFATLVLDLEQCHALPSSNRAALARALAERIRAVEGSECEPEKARELLGRLDLLRGVVSKN